MANIKRGDLAFPCRVPVYMWLCDSNLASAASPLLARQLGTAFHHQFKN